MFRTDMNEVNVQPIDLSEALWQGIQFRLDLAPIVLRRPIARERLDRCACESLDVSPGQRHSKDLVQLRGQGPRASSPRRSHWARIPNSLGARGGCLNSEIAIPSDFLQKWQRIVDLLANIMRVPSAVVTKMELPACTSYRTIVSSNSKGNPFPTDEIFSMDIGTFCETVIKNRQPLLVVNGLEDDAWKSAPEMGVGMVSYLGYPVSWPDGRIFGTICVLDNQTNHYNDLYQELLLQCRDVLQADLQTLARLSGELKEVQDELKQERDRLRLLLNITNSMMSKLDLGHLVAALSKELGSLAKSDLCALMLPDSDREQLRIATLYQSDVGGAIGKDMTVPIKGSISGHVFRTAKSIRIDNIDEARYASEIFENPDGHGFKERVMAEGLKSACCFPLLSKGSVLGVLTAARRTERGFTTDDEVFLEQLAHQVAIAVRNALEFGEATRNLDSLTEQKRYLQEEIRSEYNFGKVVGASRGLKAVLEQVSVVAPTDSGVLILGETGTGKELIARAIHESSPRKDQAFVKLNCAAIPLGLLESELFGHEKGAFTGAIAPKFGRFELANKGTLFLDEVGDIPLELQPKLLRVLQEQEFERLGSNRTHKVNVRIVAATHRDLATMISRQMFREDLYYRLKIFPVAIPPLRQRTEDIPLLVHHFVGVYSRKMNKTINSIPKAVMEALLRYAWPGNVRELQNFLERAVILSPDSVLRAPIAELAPFDQVPQAPPAVNVLEQTEREQILRALEQSKWVVGGPNGAAARLGLKRTSLVYRIKKLGISRADSADGSQS